jgi:tRNA (cytidine/uridine-2'-O-)-methyltransferase
MERLRLALFQPDIAQNAGTLFRLSACLGLGVDVIEPCGFVFDDRKLKRAGMDYLDRAQVVRHVSWDAFSDSLALGGRRLVLLTTRGEQRHDRFDFRPGDTVMVGRESSGVPPEVTAAAAARIRIPMVAGPRSINVALAAAMVTGEALRRLDSFPADIPAEKGVE